MKRPCGSTNGSSVADGDWPFRESVETGQVWTSKIPLLVAMLVNRHSPDAFSAVPRLCSPTSIYTMARLAYQPQSPLNATLTVSFTLIRPFHSTPAIFRRPDGGRRALEYGVLVLERLPYWFVLIAMLIDALSPRSQLLSVTPLVKREVLVKVPVVSPAKYLATSHFTPDFQARFILRGQNARL